MASTALNQAPDATGKEPIFVHKHIHFMFNREQPDKKIQQQTENGFKEFVNQFRQEDGTFKGNDVKPDFKPRFCLVSG
jgi:hypothetical protein